MKDHQGQSKFRKFQLLVWKNFCMVFNNKIPLMISIFSTVILCCILVWVRLDSVQKQGDVYESKPDTLNVFHERAIKTIDKIEENRKKLQRNKPSFKKSIFVPQMTIAFASPSEETFKNFSLYVKEVYKAKLDTIYFKDCDTLRSKMKVDFYFCGICIDREFPKLDFQLVFPAEYRELDEKEAISNGWHTRLNWNALKWIDSVKDKPMDYQYGEALIAMFILYPMSYMKQNKGIDMSDYIGACVMPILTITEDQSLMSKYDFITYTIVLSYIGSTIFIFNLIVREKENAVRKHLKCKGFGIIIQNLAWMVVLFALTAFCSLLLAITLKISWNSNSSIIRRASVFKIYFFLLIYCLANASFCVMVSGFCSSRAYATFTILFCWMLFMFAAFLSSLTWEPVWAESNLSSSNFYDSLNFNLNFVKLIKFLQTHEIFREDKVWRQLFPDYLLFLIMNTVLYVVCSIISDEFNPGLYCEKFKTLKKLRRWLKFKCKSNSKLYFILTKVFKITPREGGNSLSLQDSFLGRSFTMSDLRRKFKTEPDIEANEITKYFGRRRVLNIDFIVAPKDVVAFLAPNGAGKSVLCHILGGLMKPTDGNVYLMGEDLRENPTRALENVGLAFGDLLLIMDLTVSQQITFFLRMKANDLDVDKSNSIELCKDLNLLPFKDCVTRDLKRSLKDILSVVCAFCGDSKIVIIDAMNNRLDYSYLNKYVKFLNKWRQDRTVILTTKSVSLAERTADTIFMLSHGEIVCWGSPEYLKRVFGSDIHLYCFKTKNFKHEHLEKLMHFIEKHVGHVKPDDPTDQIKVAFEIVFDAIDEIPALAQDLEENIDALELKSILIRDTTLFDIFYLINQSKSAQLFDDPMELIKRYVENTEDPGIGFRDYKEDKKSVMIWRKIKGFVFKNYWINPQPLYLVILLIGLSLLLCLRIFIVTNAYTHRLEIHKRPLHPNQYEDKTLFTSAKVPERAYDGSEIIPHTIWYYREEIFQEGFKHINTAGVPITEFLIEIIRDETHNSYASLVQGGLQKERLPNTKKPYLIAYFNIYRQLSYMTSLRQLFNAFFRTMFGANYSITAYFHPMRFAAGDPNDIESIKYASFIFAFGIVTLMEFPLFLFYEEDPSFELSTQMLNCVKGIEYWIASFLCLLPQILILSVVFVCFLKIENDVISDINFDCICVLILIILLGATYCRYFRVLISKLIRDAFLTDMFMVAGIVVASLYYSYKTSSESYYHRKEIPELYFFFLPLIFIYDLISLVVYEEEVRRLCNNQDIQDVVKHLMPNAEFPKCGRNEKPFAAFGGYLGWLIFMISLLFALIGICDNIKVLKEKIFCWRSKKTRTQSWKRMTELESRENVLFGDHEAKKLEKRAVYMDFVRKKYKSDLAFSEDALTINKGESFLVMGLNGAGKSTFIRLIAKKISPSEGHIFIYGRHANYMSKEIAKISYYPQTFHIPDRCTVEEYILNYGMRIGVPNMACQKFLNDVGRKLRLSAEFDKNIKFCSAGEKSRIMLLLAFLGNPKIVLLDEPLADLDNIGLNDLCNLIKLYRRTGGTVISTSTNQMHFQELCDRVGVLTNGRFQFIGTMQAIRTAFAHGYLLNVKLLSRMFKNDRVRMISKKIAYKNYIKYANFVEMNFEGARETAAFRHYVHYFIPSISCSLSQILKKLNDHYENLNIAEFTISTNTISLMHDDPIFFRSRSTKKRSRKSNL